MFSKLARVRRGVLLAAFILLLVSLSPLIAGAGQSPSAADSVEAVVARGENAVLASFSPLSGASEVGRACAEGHCPALHEGGLNIGDAESLYSDRSTYRPRESTQRIRQLAFRNFSSKGSLNLMKARNDVVLYASFSTPIAAHFAEVAGNHLEEEAQFLEGNTGLCGSFQCSLVSAAGADVVRIQSVSLSSESATVVAIVRGWQCVEEIGASSSDSRPFRSVSTSIVVTDHLERQGDGSWRIVERVGHMLGGSAP